MRIITTILQLFISFVIKTTPQSPFKDPLFFPQLNNPSINLQRNLLQKPVCQEEIVICPPCIELNPFVYQAALKGSCTSIPDTTFHACLNTLLDDSVLENILQDDCYSACKEDFNDTSVCSEISINSIECEGGIASAYYACDGVHLSANGYEQLASAVKQNLCQWYEGFDLYNCNGTLTAQNLHDAVAENKCQLQCVADENSCGQQCDGGEYVCSEDARLSVSTYMQLKDADGCFEDLDPSYCIAEESIIVKKDVYNAVQQDDCDLQCPADIEQDTCPIELTLTGQSLGFQGYDLIYGKFRNCSQDCDYGQGSGIRERGIFCVEKATGLPTTLEKCDVTVNPNSVNLTVPCGQDTCPGYYWDYGPWSECPNTCVAENNTNSPQIFSQRTALCKNMENKQIVSENSTDFQTWCAQNSPVTARPCYTEFCEQRSFEIGEWGECVSGQKFRDVKCKDQNNKQINVLECIKSMKYVPPSSTTCEKFLCESRTDCNENGHCKNNRCFCNFGFYGVKCEISNAQCNTGVMDKQKQCCNSGFVSSLTGKCCEIIDQQPVTLDKFGHCCNNYLNFQTGECGVDHQFIDMFTGEGCKTGLTAGGRCAPDNAEIDQFGVPNGYSRSGKISIGIKINSKNETSITHQQLQSMASKIFNIKPGQIKVSKYEIQQENYRVTAQSARGRLLLQDLSENRLLQFSPPYKYDMTYGSVIERMQDVGQFDVLSVKAEGISGNGICEVGEQGVSKDCPQEFFLAPVGRGDIFCSGQGSPLHSIGRCLCWAGYEGDACQQCAEGFHRINGLCQASLTLLQTAEYSTQSPENLQIQGILRQANIQELQGQQQTDNQNEDNTKETAGSNVGIIVGAVMGCIAVMVGIVAAYAVVQRHRRRATATSIVNSTADDTTVSGASWTFTNPETEENINNAGNVDVGVAEEQQNQPSVGEPRDGSFSNTSVLSSGVGRGSNASTNGNNPIGDSRYKVVLLNNNPLPQMLSWLSTLGINSDQVEVRTTKTPSSQQQSDAASMDDKSAKSGALPARSSSTEQGSTVGSSSQSWDRGFKVAEMLAKSAGSNQPLISAKSSEPNKKDGTVDASYVDNESQQQVN